MKKNQSKKVGYYCIDPSDIIGIAKRHGIYPNKKGVLPHTKPPARVIRYSDAETAGYPN